MSSCKIRVAVCGGGIGGLCLAVALSRYPDIQVDVYEAAERFKEIGAGVMLWARPWKILELLGLTSDFSKITSVPPDDSPGVGYDFRRSDREGGFSYYVFMTPYGCIRFHRAHFLDVLVDQLPPEAAHFGKRLQGYTTWPQGSVELEFADGSSASCDLLVGCDGIKSTVRKVLFEEKAKSEGRPELLDFIDPVWSGTIAYRGLVPIDQLRTSDGYEHRAVETPLMYCGNKKHVTTYPVSRGTIVNVVAHRAQPELEGTPFTDPWVVECEQQELLDCYRGWEPEVHQLLKCITKPTRWAIHSLRPLPFYVAENVALLGDAAHAMTPHQGAGAGAAIEDAYVLAGILGHASTSRPTLARALAAYQHVRLPLANHVLCQARENGRMYEFISEYGDHYDTLGPAIGRQMDWLSETTPQGELERALAWAAGAGYSKM